MALTEISFDYRQIKEPVCVFLSMAIVWFINPYVNEFIRENTSIYEKVQESCREFVGEEYSTWTGSGESQTEFINEMNLPELLRMDWFRIIILTVTSIWL